MTEAGQGLNGSGEFRDKQSEGRQLQSAPSGDAQPETPQPDHAEVEPADAERTKAELARIHRRWALIFAAIAIAFAGTILALNSTLYSASGFVSSYLDALARGDSNGALGMPGVRIEANANDDLLLPDTLGDLGDIRLISDRDSGGGIHTLVYDVDGSRTTFEVEYTGLRLGLISTWAFATSPSAVLEITPVGDASFDANGVTITSSAGPSVVASYAVMVPSIIELSHESAYLTAAPIEVRVTDADVVAVASVNPQANEQFVSRVQEELDRLLDECATQEVLQPSGCPFGERISNRVVSTPKWSIAQYPVITIAPGATAGTWEVPPTSGQANLSVDVQSLFDGTVSTYNENTAFTLSYVITFTPDGGLSIIGR